MATPRAQQNSPAPQSRARQYNPYNDWGVDSRGREVNALGQHKIRGYSQKQGPSRSFGGLNEHYIRNSVGGSREAVDDMAQDARKAGVLVDRNGVRMADNWENRGFNNRSGRNPYPTTPQGPTADQQRWAKAAVAVPNGRVDEGVAMGEGDGPDEDADVTMPPGIGPMVESRAAAANPYTYTRAGNIENAKAAGEFDDVRNKYNSDINNRGYNMDENGTINPMSKEDDGTGTSPFARARFGPGAEEIRARRDFDRGEAPVQFSDPNAGPNADEMSMRPIRAEKINPYGTATATLTPDGSAAKPGGTMTDPLTGKTVPMKQWAANQSAVQAAKYGPDAPPRQLGQNQSRSPLGQGDAERFRRAIRGGNARSRA